MASRRGGSHKEKGTNALNLMKKLKKAKKAYSKAREEVSRLEFDYVQMCNEYRKMSPRAVRQGWVDELQKSKKEHRDWVTKAKFDTIFEKAPAYRKLVAEKEKAEQRLKDIDWSIRRVQIHRERELQGLWARESEKKWRTERRKC